MTDDYADDMARLIRLREWADKNGYDDLFAELRWIDGFPQPSLGLALDALEAMQTIIRLK